jgi:preprotein translocase subunit SecF
MRRRGDTPDEGEDEGHDEPEREEHDSSPSHPVIAFYEKHYLKLMAIPFTMLIVAMALIGYQTVTTGSFVAQDVSLKGGLTVTYLTDEGVDTDVLEEELQQAFPNGDVRARGISELGDQVGVTVDASDIEQDELIDYLSGALPGDNEFSIERIGPALGQSFFQQTMIALGVAFLFMALVVFYYFRTIVPSAAVVLAAFSDIVVTIAVMNVLDIRLSTAGIAALLMLIGYSVDTDILLSTRVLRRKNDTTMERMLGAVKTGLTMNCTTLSAIGTALIISNSDTITQIMTILLIGLIVDVINTWLQNTGILTIYVKRGGA